MKVTTNSVFDILLRLRDTFQVDNAAKNFGTDEPFRSELYNSHQMNRYGPVVAKSHKLSDRKSPDKLLRRLDDNEKVLIEVRNLLVESLRQDKAITPAAEWLLDNFYLIEEQVVIARKHLPKGYSEALPSLEDGVSGGMPRVYDIVLEIISHSDGRVDESNLAGFIESYQTHTVLTLGELWAIPIMLRLAVIENLRRVSARIALDMIDHNLADYWAEKMTTTLRETPADLILTIADMARSKPVLGSAFVAGFTRQLQGKGPALQLPLTWMEQQLTEMGTTSNELVMQENQKQASDQVSVRNSIGTLRFIGATDWRDFVEALSSVEKVLRQDPSGTYVHMDFSTRDRYRHVVEAIAKSSELSETEVAQKAIDIAKSTAGEEQVEKKRHVGYYLVDKGLDITEKAAQRKYTLRQRWVRFASSMPVFFYVTSIVLFSILLAAGLCYLAYSYGRESKPLLALLCLVSIIGSSQLAVSLVNWISTILVKPKLLSRMDFSEGIPQECKTLIVVPTMLSSRVAIEELIEGIEIRYLANSADNLYFGLLTDFPDADVEVKPDDEQLLQVIGSKIEALNEKYKKDAEDIFFLFHRPRKWNPKQKKWMGYERKRGKLGALNALLRGHGESEFSFVTGTYEVLRSVKYIITLDSDTQIPRDAAWKFIATMAHPLNKAVYSAKKRRVVEGYGILQPRVSSVMPKATPTLYLRMQGDISGIDPYTRVSSDVYQDVFGEGSFIGKGIYDIDVFEQALNQVFPENRILSHDLLEGCYARCGLLSDVFLYEENPAQYAADIKRHHRWIRGDWQIASWVFPFIPTSKARFTKNRLSALARWKIFDNLRRSLVPISLLFLLLIGWALLPMPWFWTSVVTVIYLLPVMIAAVWQLLRKPDDLAMRAHFAEAGTFVRDNLLRFIFNIAILPYEVYRYKDAIIRTLWRMLITKRNLLEWTPSSAVSRNLRHGIVSSYLAMWVVPFLSLVTTGLLIYMRSETLWVAFPFLVLWLLAPALSWRMGIPEPEESPNLTDDQTVFLHKSARKTWAYFKEFVTEEDNWLPPDNYQERPSVIAHRTSPTNLGLALLSNLTAYDFGYIASGELIDRTRKTLDSMMQLERYQGHFLNWYDTLSQMPLLPRYVSSVDSGNLIGHLFVLKQGLISVANQPVYTMEVFRGLRTTLDVVKEYANGSHTEEIEDIQRSLNEVNAEENSLMAIKRQLNEITAAIDELVRNQTDKETELYRWSIRYTQQIAAIKDDLDSLFPWLDLSAIPEKFAELTAIDKIPTLIAVRQMPALLSKINSTGNTREENEWLEQLRNALASGSAVADERLRLLYELANQCEQLTEVDYKFLFDKATSLLTIGYNVDDRRVDNSYYDLLASEVRLGIFVAIAQGKLPQEAWFSLGRLLTNSGGDPILLSWSGSMFEYLMPQLVMPVYENTLLYQTNKATVKRQIDYAAQRNVPWGISESGYNRVDANLNYQYRAFGVPGLGLKRGLEDDLVIAPYASMMALMVMPAKACANLQLLSKEGFEGEYGFYEAIDYTPARLPRNKENVVIQSFMVHHQGMGFLSLAYLLLNKPMQQRFVSELRFQATLLLLQERIPRATVFYAHTADLVETKSVNTDVQMRTIQTPNTILPELQLLSNGKYQVMVTNSGGGYSKWKDISVTRWREDSTKDDRGIFCYIKDVDSGDFWSNTYQPTLHPAKGYSVVFSQGHVEFRRHDHGIDTKTEVVISPEDDAEMRRVKITNRTQVLRTIEVTSYAEVVMANQNSDEAHAAFSNLFVQTEITPEHKAIFCTRRARSSDETPPWMFHLMEVEGGTVEAVSYETERLKFIGRGRTLVHPVAMDQDSLSGSQGAVLDPIVAIRYRITLKPFQTVNIDMVYGMSETRVSCQSLMYKYRDRHLKKRAFELSWTHSQVLLRQINATEADAQLYNRLATSVIFSNPALRAEPSVILNNYKGQSGLWSHSISGDLPIVLLRIYDPSNVELVRQLVQAHAYWRLKGLAVDLVIWNGDHGSYRQVLQEQILGLIGTEPTASVVYGRSGNIFVKSDDQLSAEDRILFESVARVIIQDNRGTLSEQVNRRVTEKALPQFLDTKPVTSLTPVTTVETVALPHDLLFYNGTGGFTADGKEYKILTDRNKATPAPWVNVIANPSFGTVLSESGSAYTWAVNAHAYRITPWSNDPVMDVGGEAFYLRDEESGDFWSPSPFPAPAKSPYITTHGFGYTSFDHIEQGISSQMLVFADKTLPVKFVVIKVKNTSGRERKCSATGYLEMILGDVRSKTNMHILSEYHNGAMLVKNRYNTAFTERVSFFKVHGSSISYTADRTEFIGRNGTLEEPQAMFRKKLSGRSGAGMDTCAALQLKFDLLDGEEKDIIFQVGSAVNIHAAKDLIKQFEVDNAVLQSLQDVKAFWEEALSAVKVTTPDKALNMLANGWLVYQTMVSRLFARSGFYQSGGAFGFRDQLQDVLALLHTKPNLAREQILLSASRQFVEGDVQHWWHPPEGRGVRTHCSDDMLWLPFAVARYVTVTGDKEILDVEAGFLECRQLHEGEDSLYDLPVRSNQYASLYEHCVRAIKHSLRFGKHGLPFIGSGDWNDGMDQVGHKGRGESVWLAFFLYDVLMKFEKVATEHNDAAFAEECKAEAIKLQSNIEMSGWDGHWYMRAYFDDDTPLGSKANEECKIDAIAQSWSVLSGAGNEKRRVVAMSSLDNHLVNRKLKLIQLLEPAFDKSNLKPGYIKGYVPGVRENGGQYSHAAIWALMAFAALGDREKVAELFNMVQPIGHSLDAEAAAIYKVEPYVMAADVYASETHKGRGGWTWYTGSSGWMYQFIISSYLGMELNNDQLVFKPCFPLEWPNVTIEYRYKNSRYYITVYQDEGNASKWRVDGESGEGASIPLVDDGKEHKAEVYVSVQIKNRVIVSENI